MALSKFRTWWNTARRIDRQRLAQLSDSSIASLYLAALGHNNMSAARAARVADALRRMSVDVDRGDLCVTCRRCPHYQGKGGGQ